MVEFSADQKVNLLFDWTADMIKFIRQLTAVEYKIYYTKEKE